jgi:hypothetical protein
MLFGGFGFNVFNPALVGYLFIAGTYHSAIAQAGGNLNKMELDTIGGATPLANLQNLNYIDSYNNVVQSFGNLNNFLFGFIPGSLGETSALLCLIGLIYLIITKVISWRIPVIYIASVFVITGIIGYYNDLGLWYPTFHILSGGLMFGAIFMATDPVSSPTTPYGQIIYALFLGLFTVIFRFLTSYPEGVLTAILTLNMLVFIIDKLGSSVRFHYKKIILSSIIATIIILSITIYMAINVTKGEDGIDTSFEIIDIQYQDNQTIYLASHRAFHGVITANIIINDKGKIVDIEIVEQKEDVWHQIENANYLKRIIEHQANLKELDTIAGATYTTDYLKQLASKVLAEHNKRIGD